MASVWKHPNSPFWTACYTLPDGQRVKKSTKLKNKTKALQVANALESERGKVLTRKAAQALVSDLMRRQGSGDLQVETTASFLERWLKRKAVEVDPNTHRKYSESARHLVTFLGRAAERDVATLTAQEIARFRDDLATRLSPGTVNVHLKIIRVALADAVRESLLSTNEAAKVATLTRSKVESARRCFSVEELKGLLEVASGEWRGLIQLGLYTGGQRLGDVARLTWGNVDIERGELRFRTRKTGRQQILPLSEKVRAALLALPSADSPAAYVFPAAAAKLASSKGGHSGSLSNEFHKLLVLAGLAKPHSKRDTGEGHGGRRAASTLGFHSLRHTATSLLKLAGVSPAIVQDIVGHDSAAISMHYTHVGTDAKRAALDLLPDI